MKNKMRKYLIIIGIFILNGCSTEKTAFNEDEKMITEIPSYGTPVQPSPEVENDKIDKDKDNDLSDIGEKSLDKNEQEKNTSIHKNEIINSNNEENEEKEYYLCKTKEYLSNGELQSWTEYDEQGNKTKVNILDEGSIVEEQIYEYNDKGDLSRIIIYRDGNAETELSYEYDETKNEIILRHKWIEHQDTGEAIGGVTIDKNVIYKYDQGGLYEYDKDGNAIRYKAFYGGLEIEYEYDEFGNKEKEWWYFYNESEERYLSNSIGYENIYDEAGKLKKVKRYGSSGNLWDKEDCYNEYTFQDEFNYEYDKVGNKIKETRYYERKINYWREYEYGEISNINNMH